MGGRFFVPGILAFAIAIPGITSGLAAPGSDLGSSAASDRYLLSCSGAMRTDGSLPHSDDADSRIEASGLVDLATGTVRGFGIGSAPIVVVTAATIGFGAAAVDRVTTVADAPDDNPPTSGPLVEGTIDRNDGATMIVVHPAGDPSAVAIAMALSCRFGTPPA